MAMSLSTAVTRRPAVFEPSSKANKGVLRWRDLASMYRSMSMRSRQGNRRARIFNPFKDARTFSPKCAEVCHVCVTLCQSAIQPSRKLYEEAPLCYDVKEKQGTPLRVAKVIHDCSRRWRRHFPNPPDVRAERGRRGGTNGRVVWSVAWGQ